MSREKFNNQNQYVLAIKKCLFYQNRLSYIAPIFLILSLFLILGFQNCTDKNSQTLAQIGGGPTPEPQPYGPGSNLIKEVSLEETKHPDLLEISASLNSQVQDDFAAESTVDLALSPSDHKNLQVLQESNVYTNWTISNEAWNGYYYNYIPCSPTTTCEIQKDGTEVCTSYNDSCSEYLNSSTYETITTVDADTQFQFSDVGVYDISARIQEIVPPKMIVNPDGSVTQGSSIYTDQGPKYERSLVVGKCDQGDLQIINSKDPIQNAPSTTSTTQIVNSINSITSNNHLSYAYSYYGQASRYASLFLLELDGKVLEFESSYYSYSYPDYTPGYNPDKAPSVPDTSDNDSSVGSIKSEEQGSSVNQLSLPSYHPSSYYSDERKVKWKLMAEIIDPTYGRWYDRFDQQERLGGWYVPWPENDVRYFYGSSVTSGATFSGKFVIEAFVQLPGEECVYSAKKTFQLSEHLIPSIKVETMPTISTKPLPVSVPSITTTTTTTTSISTTTATSTTTTNQGS